MRRLLENVESELFLQRIFARQKVREGFAAHVLQSHEAELAAVIL